MAQHLKMPVYDEYIWRPAGLKTLHPKPLQPQEPIWGLPRIGDPNIVP